jgi:hypothetical protein
MAGSGMFPLSDYHRSACITVLCKDLCWELIHMSSCFVITECKYAVPDQKYDLQLERGRHRTKSLGWKPSRTDIDELEGCILASYMLWLEATRGHDHRRPGTEDCEFNG